MKLLLVAIQLLILTFVGCDSLPKVSEDPLACRKVTEASCDSRETVFERCRVKLDNGEVIKMYDLVIPGDKVCPSLDWHRTLFQ